MKTSLKVAALALTLLAADVAAQNPTLTYRMQDPFLFCTRGQDRQKNPAPCWIPIPPYLGQSFWMPYCDPPNPYGKTWSNDDNMSYAQYMQVCPKGVSPGSWEGKGQPDRKPFRH